MFRIEFFCDDKRLAAALHALTGIALQAPKVMPMINATAKNGKVEANGNGDNVSLFQAWARKHKKTTLKALDFREFVSEIGRSPTSYSYFAKYLTDHGAVKRTGKGPAAVYKVVT